MIGQYASLLMPAIERAGEGYTLEDVEREVSEGRAIFWPGEHAAAVTCVHEVKAMHIWAAGGDMRELMRMESSLETLSRQIDCHLMMAGGRDGWARALRPLGWNAFVVKDLRK